MKRLLLTSLAVAALAGSATAPAAIVDAFYYNDTAMAIPDNDPAGIQSTISVPDNFTISRLALVVVMDHTWVGDLIFTLTGPDGTTITLADRPGTDDPSVDFGDSSNLSGDYPIIFGDRSPIPAEMMGAGSCTGTDSVIGLDCHRWHNPDTSLGGTWAGLSAFGDWTLSISDNAEFDLGTLNGWLIAFEYQAIPLPPAVWLFASGLLALVARRRRL